MRVLVACEFSKVVSRTFEAKGHEVWSCDLLPAPNFHFECDVALILGQKWDLMIGHPPCTHLAVSGARWFKNRQNEQKKAIHFFISLINANIPKIAIENPIGIMSTKYRKPDQIIQPWQFGHGETKATCLWLKGLPKLEPTDIVEGREARIHRMPPSKDRGRLRSITYEGIALAMAEQWG